MRSEFSLLTWTQTFRTERPSLKENLNASRPSEHPPVRGEMFFVFCKDTKYSIAINARASFALNFFRSRTIFSRELIMPGFLRLIHLSARDRAPVRDRYGSPIAKNKNKLCCGFICSSSWYFVPAILGFCWLPKVIDADSKTARTRWHVRTRQSYEIQQSWCWGPEPPCIISDKDKDKDASFSSGAVEFLPRCSAGGSVADEGNPPVWFCLKPITITPPLAPSKSCTW